MWDLPESKKTQWKRNSLSEFGMNRDQRFPTLTATVPDGTPIHIEILYHTMDYI